jgi:hypothetical protein
MIQQIRSKTQSSSFPRVKWNQPKGLLRCISSAVISGKSGQSAEVRGRKTPFS